MENKRYFFEWPDEAAGPHSTHETKLEAARASGPGCCTGRRMDLRPTRTPECSASELSPRVFSPQDIQGTILFASTWS